MGGALFIIVVALLWAFVWFLLPQTERDSYIPQTIVPVGALVGVGALGAIDDFVNVKYGFGIRGRHKLVWQTIVAVAAAIYIQKHFAVNGIFVPLAGEWVVGAVVFGIVAVIAIVGTSNGVNVAPSKSKSADRRKRWATVIAAPAARGPAAPSTPSASGSPRRCGSFRAASTSPCSRSRRSASGNSAPNAAGI